MAFQQNMHQFWQDPQYAHLQGGSPANNNGNGNNVGPPIGAGLDPNADMFDPNQQQWQQQGQPMGKGKGGARPIGPQAAGPPPGLGAVPTTPFTDPMQATVHLMAQSVQQTSQQLMYMISNQQQSTGGNQGYRALKPKASLTTIKADTPKDLMLQVMQFEIDLGELGVNIRSEAAYRQLRSMCEGKAKDV